MGTTTMDDDGAENSPHAPYQDSPNAKKGREALFFVCPIRTEAITMATALGGAGNRRYVYSPRRFVHWGHADMLPSFGIGSCRMGEGCHM